MNTIWSGEQMRDWGLFYIKISEKYSLRKDLNAENIKQGRDPLEMLSRKKQQHGQKMLTDKLINGKLEILEIIPYIQISNVYIWKHDIILIEVLYR